jgi:hypothetical protein
MTYLNIDFLISGKQFVNKLKGNTPTNTNVNGRAKKCAWSVKNLKSNNHYYLTEQIKKLQHSNQ